MGECFALVEKEEAETILEELLEKASAKVRGRMDIESAQACAFVTACTSVVSMTAMGTAV
eukprot:SAG31_NODE_5866_length_2283_cov_1.711538_2_plen_60_part_00